MLTMRVMSEVTTTMTMTVGQQGSSRVSRDDNHVVGVVIAGVENGNDVDDDDDRATNERREGGRRRPSSFLSDVLGGLTALDLISSLARSVGDSGGGGGGSGGQQQQKQMQPPMSGGRKEDGGYDRR